jgi:cytochrome c biogenesis protein CcdA
MFRKFIAFALTYITFFVLLLLVCFLIGMAFLLNWNDSEFGRIGQGMMLLFCSTMFAAVVAIPVTLWFRRKATLPHPDKLRRRPDPAGGLTG